MLTTRLLPLAMGALLCAAPLVYAAPAAAQERNYVAVVVGLSTYEHLPKEVQLDFARSDAATVAQAFRDGGKFTQVFLLRDGEATKAGITETLRQKAPQFVGPNDVVIVYFVGHGVGADLGQPMFLTYDSTIENANQDGFELAQLATDLQTWLHAGTTIIVTDAIHRNQLDGISFFGPAASEWPAMPNNTLILSASSPATPGRDGAFGQIFAQGVSGAADKDGDHQVTAGELVDFVTQALSSTGQKPIAAGTYDPAMVVIGNVSGTGVVNYVTESNQKPPEPVFPDIEIPAAKFVFIEGEAQKISCRDEAPVDCVGSCYVRTFKAGPCDVAATVDGVPMTGKVTLIVGGKYECGRRSGQLTCWGPLQ